MNEIEELKKRVEQAEDTARRSFKTIIWGGFFLLLLFMGMAWMMVNGIVASAEMSKTQKSATEHIYNLDKRVEKLESEK